MNLEKTAKILFSFALAAWLYSLTLPCIIYKHAPSADEYGGWLLLIGEFGIFSGMFAWYANLSALCAVIALKSGSYKEALNVSILSFIISLQSFGFKEKWLDEGGAKKLIVDHLGIGFYIWELSFILLVASCWLYLLHSNKNKPQKATFDPRLIIMLISAVALLCAVIGTYFICIFLLMLYPGSDQYVKLNQNSAFYWISFLFFIGIINWGLAIFLWSCKKKMQKN